MGDLLLRAQERQIMKDQFEPVEDLRSGWLPGLEPPESRPRAARATKVSGITPLVANRSKRVLNGPRNRVIGTRITKQKDQSAEGRHWPAFNPSRFAASGSVAERIDRNLAAVGRLAALRANPLGVTDEDRHILLAFSGWGGAGRMFEPLPGNSLEPKRSALAAMVTPEAMAATRSGVVRANHTAHEVAALIWKVVRQLGFTGGRVIDPAAGNGHILAAMPPDMALNSDITCIETDLLKAELLHQTFLGLGVKTATRLSDVQAFGSGYYDLAVGHVPSGGEKPEEHCKTGFAKWCVTDYYVGKALDLLRPEGLAVMLVPTTTMDSEEKRHRNWINAHARLIAAYRLPASAVSSCNRSGHAVDILILMKRKVPLYPLESNWATIVQAPLAVMRQGQLLEHQVRDGRVRKWVDRPRPINQWYADNPHAVIGELSLENASGATHPWSIAFKGDRGALTTRLSMLVDALPQESYQADRGSGPSARSLLLSEVPACRLVKPGAFVTSEGRIYVARDELVWLDVDDAYHGRARSRVLGLIKLREAATMGFLPLADAQELATMPAPNEDYDQFVRQFGAVACSANEKLFGADPDWELLLEFEVACTKSKP